MKKKVCLCMLILTLAIGLFSCSDNESDNESDSKFTVVSKEDAFEVMYDNQTKVMYTVVRNGCYAHGVVTLLVNSDGTPKLWMGGE